MNYNLTNACLKDKYTIYQIKKDSLKNYIQEIWGWDEEFQQKDFDNDFVLQNYKLIKTDNKIIGFLETNEKADKINICEIHIIPDYQGQGIGSDIIKNIINQAKNNNKTVELGCFIANTNAKRLYLKLGFEIIQQTKTHFIFTYPLETKNFKEKL